MRNIWRNLRRSGGLLALAAMLAASLSAGIASAAGAGGDTADAASSVAAKAAAAEAVAADYVLAHAPLSDWGAVALAGSGRPVPESYLTGALEQVRAAKDGFRRVTDAERLALGILAAGGNPRAAAGTDLAALAANSGRMTAQGLNGPVYALILMHDAGSGADWAGSAWTPGKLREWIVARQHADGGWGLTDDAPSDADMTAMAIVALTPYVSEPAAGDAVRKATAWLNGRVAPDGGLSGAFATSESASQAIVAFSAVLSLDGDYGADRATTDKLVAWLLGLQRNDGGFAHAVGQDSNGMATEQALLALAAYDRLAAGKRGSVYEFSLPVSVSVEVEGPSGPVGVGQAQATDALDALEQAAAGGKWPLDVKMASFGRYVNAIDGIEAGRYGGYDGWMYAVRRGDGWIFPQVGMADFPLAAGDRLLVYYGDQTALIQSVTATPEAPKAGQPFDVAVVRAAWDSAGGTMATAPASGVKVSAGTVSAVTDEKGIAHFAGLSAGAWRLEVSGYRADAAPSVVRWEGALRVRPAEAAATVAADGPDGHLFDADVKAGNALDGLKQAAAARGADLTVTDSSMGAYVSAVQGIEAGRFGGYDGWMFAVRRAGAWIVPASAMAGFELEPRDLVEVYYGGDDTQFVAGVETSPAQPKPGQPFTATVTKEAWDWTNNRFVVSPAGGVRVAVGGWSAVTDDQGRVAVPGLAAGKHELTVSGFSDGAAPQVVRQVVPLYVFTDAERVSDWAAPSLREAFADGLLSGVDKASPRADPARDMTRAEWAAMLLRAIGVTPADGGSSAFADVPASAWYAGAVARAGQLGIADVASGDFRPDAPITRAEAAVMAAKALGLPDGAPAAYPDVQEAAPEAAKAIGAVADAGLMIGSGGAFHPQEPLTREMAAVVAVKAYRYAGDHALR